MIAVEQKNLFQEFQHATGYYTPSSAAATQMVLPLFQPRRLWTEKSVLRSKVLKSAVETRDSSQDHRERSFTMKGGYVQGKGLVIVGKIFHI